MLAIAAATPVFARNLFCPSSELCRDNLVLSSGGNIQYYRSAPLSPSDLIQRAVVVIHGNRRDADRYYDRALAAAAADRDAGNRSDSVLLLAPNFRTIKDRPARGEHYWSSHGWKIGHKSLDAVRVSSFAVMNEILGRLCGVEPAMFPRLRTIVIVGHSAGGQFVNRYAAGGEACRNEAIEVRYVVMNPSSYLYIDSRRRTRDDPDFAPVTGGCRDYDDYKYGLQDLNAYMESVGVRQIRNRLMTRRVYYLAGVDDTRADSSLDTRCEARLQGPNRLARFANYRDYAGLFREWTGSVFITVPGVGHDGGKMLASEAARQVMFH